jgi:hypothetical protein
MFQNRAQLLSSMPYFFHHLLWILHHQFHITLRQQQMNRSYAACATRHTLSTMLRRGHEAPSPTTSPNANEIFELLLTIKIQILNAINM